MISDLDELIKQLLIKEAAFDVAEVDIGFETLGPECFTRAHRGGPRTRSLNALQLFDGLPLIDLMVAGNVLNDVTERPCFDGIIAGHGYVKARRIGGIGESKPYFKYSSSERCTWVASFMLALSSSRVSPSLKMLKPFSPGMPTILIFGHDKSQPFQRSIIVHKTSSAISILTDQMAAITEHSTTAKDFLPPSIYASQDRFQITSLGNLGYASSLLLHIHITPELKVVGQ